MDNSTSIIINRLNSCPDELITETVKELSHELNLSVASIWRKANKAGFRVRKERADKNATVISEDVINYIASRVLISRRRNKQFTNSIKKAYEDYEKEHGKIAAGYERVCAILRQRGLDKVSLNLPAPALKLESLQPNHVHLFDVTNCLQWHFKNKGGLSERDVEKIFYQNKVVKEAKKIKQELLRFVLIDHKSGAFFFWYYYSSGEKASDGLDFFSRAWGDKKELVKNTLGISDYNGKYQFQGLPKILYSDKGSILKNKAMLNMMQSLGVQVETHEAGNPRAKGAVEGLMRIIGYDFESDLKTKNIQGLEALNAFALNWCIERNLKPDFRGGNIPRIDFWRKIKDDELTLSPDYEMFKKLYHKPEVTRVCTVQGIINFEGRKYHCSDTNAYGKTVLIKVNALEYPAIDIHFNGYVYKSEPLEVDEYNNLILPNMATFGSFNALKKTELQHKKEELEQFATEKWGVEYKGKKDKKIALPSDNTPKAEIEVKQDNIAYLPKAGKQAEVKDSSEPVTTAPVETHIIHNYAYVTQSDSEESKKEELKKPVLIPLMQAIDLVTSEYGKISPLMNKNLKTLYPEGVPAELTATDIYNAINKPFIQNAKISS